MPRWCWGAGADRGRRRLWPLVSTTSGRPIVRASAAWALGRIAHRRRAIASSAGTATIPNRSSGNPSVRPLLDHRGIATTARGGPNPAIRPAAPVFASGSLPDARRTVDDPAAIEI